ncbi:olfactory receptor 14J1-like, partial [Camarhynchus parvulus]|uniref:olfactory receptor 14J1-like n=1 Tax=Geospiza parvula TaxID=87175 RepID=UPI001237B760
SLLGNGLIISAVACGHHLHTPMFFFLLNLALSDLGSICTTVFFISAEYYVLAVMCYNSCVSICKPLHYRTFLGSRAYAHMAAAAWASGFLAALLHTANTFSLPLCQGNVLGQLFCEIPQIFKLSCSQSYLRKNRISVVGVCLSFGCFVFIVFSYVLIFRAVLRIPAEQGWQKAFFICLPHLAIVSVFLSTAAFAYLKPHSNSFPSLDLVVSILYSAVPLALKPLIYSLRNQELKDALEKLMKVSSEAINSLFC